MWKKEEQKRQSASFWPTFTHSRKFRQIMTIFRCWDADAILNLQLNLLSQTTFSIHLDLPLVVVKRSKTCSISSHWNRFSCNFLFSSVAVVVSTALAAHKNRRFFSTFNLPTARNITSVQGRHFYLGSKHTFTVWRRRKTVNFYEKLVKLTRSCHIPERRRPSHYCKTASKKRTALDSLAPLSLLLGGRDGQDPPFRAEKADKGRPRARLHTYTPVDDSKARELTEQLIY